MARRSGLGINLLVADASDAVSFANDVFGAETVYADRDFTVFKLGEIKWMVRADPVSYTHLTLPTIAKV